VVLYIRGINKPQIHRLSLLP